MRSPASPVASVAGSAVLTAASFSRHSRTGTGPCLRSQRLTYQWLQTPRFTRGNIVTFFQVTLPPSLTLMDAAPRPVRTPQLIPCMSRYRTNAHWQAKCTPFPPTRAPPTMVQRPPALSLSALSHNFLFQASSSSLAACERCASKDKSTNPSSLRFAHCFPPHKNLE